MARFHGMVGYATPMETPPGSGIWKDNIVELPYFGDVVRNIRRTEESEGVNDDIAINNAISIVADEYANQHFFKIKYVRWAGVYWKISSVEVRHPRLILNMGGVYNGPKA